MRYSVEQIEDLLVAKVAAGLAYLKTVDSYASKYDLTLEQLTYAMPAVFVFLESIGPGTLDHFGVDSHAYTFNLGVVCRDLRGPEEGRRGDEGAYRIIDDLWGLLQGAKLAQGLEPLEFGGVELVLSTNVGVAYRATYTLEQAGGQ